VIRKEAWPFNRTSSGVRLCWELEESNGPKGPKDTRLISPFFRPPLVPTHLPTVRSYNLGIWQLVFLRNS